MPFGKLGSGFGRFGIRPSLPLLASGFAFLVDSSGRFLIDASGKFLVGAITP